MPAWAVWWIAAARAKVANTEKSNIAKPAAHFSLTAIRTKRLQPESRRGGYANNIVVNTKIRLPSKQVVAAN